MKIAVLDANYTKTEYHGMAASWLRWELGRRNINVVPVKDAEYLLITVSSQQGIARARAERRKNKQALAIIGGGGCYAPAIFDGIADYICVGEGSNFINKFLFGGVDAIRGLPETWIPGDTRQVVPACDFPWNLPPVKHPDGTYRVFGSRGCRFKCLFCQTGWESEFRANPSPDKLKKQIAAMEKIGHRIAIVTNDGADNLVVMRGQQEFLSVSLRNLKKIMPLRRDQVKGVRIGVEGISERLRTAVGKKVDNDDLLSVTAQLLENGIGVRWFFIPGIPGENDGDYAELRYLVIRAHKFGKGAVMMNFHSFIPMPATPLCVFPLYDEYWELFDEWRRWFFHGPGFTRRVQIVAPNQYKSRLRRAMESMAATEHELRRGWWQHDNPNWRVRYTKSSEQLRSVALKYAKRLCLDDKYLPPSDIISQKPELLGQ